MRISEYFNLGRSQPTLDFVDVDAEGDTRVFISPRALHLLPSAWGDECVSLVQNFFQKVLTLIRSGKNQEAEALLGKLREPNETHLGLSEGRSRGRALGSESAHDVWEALSDSEAARTGLLQDLEDTVLMVDGISTDKVSDITTNIIRQPLIRYTQEMSAYYGIPLQSQVDSGPLWNPTVGQWQSMFVELPVGPSGKLLLVPKAIVRRSPEYNVQEYYTHYLLEHLRGVELKANSSLVELLRKGGRRVTKKALKKKYGGGKSMIVRETLNHPDVLDEYRRDKDSNPVPPLSHDDLADIEGQSLPNWDALLAEVRNVAPGLQDSGRYEKAVEGLLSAIFYPVLAHPQVQQKIHQGRKRIDIVYTNMATVGFFQWVASHYPAPHLFVECKNYGSEVGNPELDQLAGRFSPSRGKLGLLVCRSFENKNLFLERCKDTAKDDHGFIIPLDDGDLSLIVEARKTGIAFFDMPLLRQRFTQLVM